ncbi:MAG: insulinase family protein, partial [Myxococcota bacterium]
MQRWAQSLIWLLLAGCAGRGAPTTEAVPSSIVDLDQRRPGDVRQQRALTLDNGLEVLLVSDANLQESSAALVVKAGSLEDPVDHLGMAHFLEHMLFLGTEKYPDESEYGAYLRGNGGYANAYTSSEHTNYFLEVNHEAYEGAIDRFAQFFIAPLFTAEFVEREMNAVESEHAKNLQNDAWRSMQVLRVLHRDGHARQKFSTGNAETLAGLTRDDMVAFYERTYSANLMNLVLMSNAPLDQLETWARDKFSPIENRELTTPSYSSDIFPDELPQRIELVPVGDRRALRIQFSVPSTIDRWATHPGRILGSLIGHEGEGSLLSALKREGLANALGAGQSSESYRGIFEISMELTEAGRADVERVIELVFGYLALLREEGLSERYFREQQIIGDLDYYFRDHPKGGDGASYLSSWIRHYPALEVERRIHTISTYDPKEFATLVDLLRPDNMRTLLVSPDVKTDKVEPFYGAAYSVQPWPDATVARWNKTTPVDGMHLPPENPFLPSDVSLLENDPKQGPYLLIDDDRGAVWFEQDRRFKLPRAQVLLTLVTPTVNASPRNRLIAELYVRAIQEGLNEWAYLVREAGLGLGLSSRRRGIQLTATGYAQRIPTLLAEAGSKLKDVVIDETTFAILKDELAREYANNELDLAVRQGFYDMNVLLDPAAIHRDDYQDLVSEITLEDIKAFAETVYDRAAVEGAAYGNLEPSALESSIDAFLTALETKPLPADERPAPNGYTLQLPKGETTLVLENGTDNHAWIYHLQFGERAPRTEALLRLGANYLAAPFFSELRTRQQLGYIVGSTPTLTRSGVGMTFYLQSGQYNAETLADRATTFLDKALPELRNLDDDAFAKLKQAVTDTLKQEEADIGERLQTVRYEGLELEGAFDWDERVAAEVATITRDELADAFVNAHSKKGQTLAMFIDAKGATPSQSK